jgi:hypothetical protein
MVYLYRSVLTLCADEWRVNNIDPDIQVHILTGVYGGEISSSPLHRVLSNLNIEHEDHDSLGQLHQKLKRYILQLRKGKDTEREQHEKHEKVVQHREQLKSIRPSWPQLVLQSSKNKILHFFRKGA